MQTSLMREPHTGRDRGLLKATGERKAVMALQCVHLTRLNYQIPLCIFPDRTGHKIFRDLEGRRWVAAILQHLCFVSGCWSDDSFC